MMNVFPDGELHEAVELGAVDSQSVRVWVRQPGVPLVTAQLEVPGQPVVTAATALSDATDWTGVIVLTLPEPAPAAPFVCTVGSVQRRGRLAPMPETHTGFVFGFGSCHRPFRVVQDRIVPNAAAGIYPAIAEDLRHTDAAFMLYGGDQVYSDELAPISVRDKLPGDEQHPPPVAVALAAYRRIARGFFGQAGMRALRASLPSYCIWDDHDIFNNWGSRLTKTPLDQCLFQAASRVYGEYQHQRNPGGTLTPPPYHYTFRFGTAGFLVLDVRGARDYPGGRLLGEEQWAAIQAYLGGADAGTLQTLFVVTTVPVAHVSRWMAKLFDGLPGKNGNQIRDRWCSAQFVHSRDALLTALFDWQAAGPTRQVVLLSGDVHAASAFTIRRTDGPGVLQQFTSSAMTSPHTVEQRLLNTLAVRGANWFEPRFRFRFRTLVYANNYGLVRVTPLPTGGHRISFTVRAWQRRRQRLRSAARVVSLPHR